MNGDRRGRAGRGGGWQGDDETACDEIEGGFHSCGLTQRKRKWIRMSLRCYTFIYLFERGETRRLTQTFVSKKESLLLIDIPEAS